MYKACTAVAAVLLAVAPTHAAEVRLVTPGALLSSLKALSPRFETASGHKFKVPLPPAVAGDPFGGAVMGQRAANDLEKPGRLAGVTLIARAGVGVFVRRGDPKPDVSTVAAFTRALLDAKVIMYSDPALGGSASNYVHELLKRLDTTGAIVPKIRLAKEYRSIANNVAAGGIDLALNQVTEIMADARLELVGPLPAELQRYQTYR